MSAKKKKPAKSEPSPVVDPKPETVESIRFVGSGTADDLTKEWNGSQILRADTDKFIRGKAWALLSRKIEQTAIENSESFQPNYADAVLARGVSFQKGVRWALRQIQNSTKPVEEMKSDEPEPFGHIDVSYLEKRRRGEIE